ncbi:MAG: hypothetical protein LBJ67_04660 [Planctomycetaceae bacterium]|jgi:hypothetical protein|nr:hypothetical protein [Planctomycetaceae bacterium]
MSITEVEKLAPVSDFYFPSSIVSRGYAVPWLKVEDISDSALLELKNRLIVEDVFTFHAVDLSPIFIDKDFTIDIPANSLWRDDTSGDTFRANDSGKLEKVLALSPDEYTRDDAFKILQEERNKERQIDFKRWNLLRYAFITVGIAMICFAIANFCRKRYLQEK